MFQYLSKNIFSHHNTILTKLKVLMNFITVMYIELGDVSEAYISNCYSISQLTFYHPIPLSGVQITHDICTSQDHRTGSV